MWSTMCVWSVLGSWTCDAVQLVEEALRDNVRVRTTWFIFVCIYTCVYVETRSGVGSCDWTGTNVYRLGMRPRSSSRWLLGAT